MALEYDREIFAEFRAKAVTDIDGFVVGKTYYCNSYPSEFVFKRLLQKKESYARHGLVNEECELFSFLTEDGSDFSLTDRNIGASYNPWLIFDNPAVAQECRDKLVIKMVKDEWDDLMDDLMDYGPENEYEDCLEDDE
jgi:hypothetical protein